MGRKLLTIRYLGVNYHGWQVQDNANTVQAEICRALEKLFCQKINATGCSRTDAKVHALKYCLHFDCEKNIPDKNIVKALNTFLPNDIRAVDCTDADFDFHARYSCKSKTYIYKIYEGIEDPFLYRRALNYSKKLDIEKMQKFADGLLGTHDFKGFSNANELKDTVRTVNECKVYKSNSKTVIIKISANGFLYNMVRVIVGTLIEVSEGKIDLNLYDEIFKTKNRNLAGFTAIPDGLYLYDVKY